MQGLRLLLSAVLLSICAACGSSGGTPPVQDYPPARPRQPERLSLALPGATDPLDWWAGNILSIVPEAVYPDTATAQQAGALAQETNRLRTEAGLSPVTSLPLLNRVAQAHAMDQAIRDYWNHRTPEDLGSRDRIAAAGGEPVTKGGENSAVAYPGETSVELVVLNFSLHPGHRDLFYDPDVRFTGVGIYNFAPSEQVHYVQLLVSF
ncbi:CAP domain-containing protein [bacterium]|nr:CAP domain-containing protein [bacterium]